MIWTQPDRSVRARDARASKPTASTCVSALENIRARCAPAIWSTRLARGVFILWAGEIPFRYSDINCAAAAG